MAGSSLFNIYDSHSLSEIALKGLANAGEHLPRKGLSQAVKSDCAKSRIKKATNLFLDDAPDKISKNIEGGAIPFPFVDFKKGWQVISDPNLFKPPQVTVH